jgi:hypothetical protein
LVTTLTLLILQFLIAAVMWVGTARPIRGPATAAPDASRWMSAWSAEPTRLVLPLLMIVAGLLFFSSPLAPVWGPALGLEMLPGLPPSIGRWAFLVLNVAVTGVLLAATGGAAGSPFPPLLIALPVVAWLAGIPLFEIGAVVVGGLALLGAGRWGGIAVLDPAPRGDPATGRFGAPRAGPRALIAVLSLLLILATALLAH